MEKGIVLGVFATLLTFFSITVASAQDTLPVDDFEDGNTVDAARNTWKLYTENSGNGESKGRLAAVKTDNGGASRYSLHVPYTLGAREGSFVYFHNWDNRTLDLSTYKGVRFRARGRGDFFISLHLEPSKKGQDNLGSDLLGLTPEWKTYELPFHNLKKSENAPLDILELITVHGIGFSFDRPYSAAGPGEIYLDDIVYYKTEQYPAKTLLVDDFEDGDHLDRLKTEWIPYVSTVKGSESTANLSTTMSPGADGSRRCLHVIFNLGKGDPAFVYFHNWNVRSFDASTFAGVRFKARGKGDFFISLITKGTEKDGSAHSSNILSLTPEWKTFELDFEALRPIYGATNPNWNPTFMHCVGFSFDQPYTASGPGEIFLDDIEFYPYDRAKAEKKKEQIQRKVAALDGKRLAVLDVASRNIDAAGASAILDFVTNAFVNLASVKVIERRDLNKVMKEQSLQLRDSMDSKAAVRLGKLLGAEVIALSSVVKLDKVYYLTVKLVDVATGEIVGVSVSAADTPSQFLTLCSDGVRKLF